MTTPGRQAAIEAAAKALAAPRPFERFSEGTKAVFREEATAVIDAYERALAEQPRGAAVIDREGGCANG